MGWLTDAWLNVAATVGVAMYFLAYLTLMQCWCTRNTWWNMALRFVGLGLIIAPLFMRWYLSQPVLLICGVILITVSAYHIYLRRG